MSEPTQQEIMDQLVDNSGQLLGVLRGHQTYIGPMACVHALLVHDWLMYPDFNQFSMAGLRENFDIEYGFV